MNANKELNESNIKEVLLKYGIIKLSMFDTIKVDNRAFVIIISFRNDPENYDYVQSNIKKFQLAEENLGKKIVLQ